MSNTAYKRVINLLSIGGLLFAVYLMSAPYLPKIGYSINKPTVTTYSNDILFRGPEDRKLGPKVSGVSTSIPFTVGEDLTKNRLSIPTIGVDGEVKEGDNSKFLKKGIWHLPYTSTPDKGSNTVIVAHRYMETSGPETFYNLDKLKVGSEIVLTWNGIRYTYEVYETKVVLPTAIEVEHATKEPILTLYTCTPLWTTTHRLVVLAKPIKSE